jgi:molecular chaperone Hsp33
MSDNTKDFKDDLVTPFHLENQPVRGRIVRLGAMLDDLLNPHELPETVAVLLGEAVITAIVAGSSLKFDGRVIVQASGSGPVSFLVSDFTSDGGVRGYIRVDEQNLPDTPQPDLKALMGEGQFALTIDPGKAEHRYQGIASLEPESFAKTAETYFKQSEQLPSRLIIAIARHTNEDGITKWRGGGLLIQRIAGEEENDDDKDAWLTALALVKTIAADELTDPMLTTDKLLLRLFHEQGVRTFDPLKVYKRCTCTKSRLQKILGNFTTGERKEMITETGQIEMTCEYCAKTFSFVEQDIQ